MLPPQSRTVHSSLLGDGPGPRHARVQQTLNHTMFPSCACWNTYNHDRQHVAPLQGPRESLRPRGGLHTSLINYMFPAGCRCENFEHFTPSLQPFTSPPSGCSRNVRHCRPTTNNASHHPRIFCGAHSTKDYVCRPIPHT